MSDLCPGYRPGKKADAGRCCCGLHWRGEMPVHTEDGIAAKNPERFLRKLSKRIDAAVLALKRRQDVIQVTKERLVYK
ncbi:MAG: hypothetical protein GY696_29165 [Gammaproteobacteria bacterium]|nr:hypothetical protein [Gammaproteobacteria bacterium]